MRLWHASCSRSWTCRRALAVISASSSLQALDRGNDLALWPKACRNRGMGVHKSAIATAHALSLQGSLARAGNHRGKLEPGSRSRENRILTGIGGRDVDVAKTLALCSICVV